MRYQEYPHNKLSKFNKIIFNLSTQKVAWRLPSLAWRRFLPVEIGYTKILSVAKKNWYLTLNTLKPKTH